MNRKPSHAVNEEVPDLKEIISNMPGYIYWKNANSQYMGCNKNLAKASGLKTPAEIVGKLDEDFPWGANQAADFRKDDLEDIFAEIGDIQGIMKKIAFTFDDIKVITKGFADFNLLKKKTDLTEIRYKLLSNVRSTPC